jgi:hypothetical protein
MEKHVKHFTLNFVPMFCSCLLIYFLTFHTCGKADIQASAIIAGVSAVLFTVLNYRNNQIEI